mmetsp:Transcript_10949/g.26832  ORF Transcript_10949/g.26832 Transcript_10949/m.26832 type:complete len:155 (-) Transcript_10949:7-471(-)
MGDVRSAHERLEAENAMNLSSELKGARAAYFDSLDTGEQVDEKKFTYAWTLIHQKSKDNIRAGIALLEELSDNKGVQRESLYYQATAQYRLEQYMDSRKSLQRLLTIDPSNRQALDMKALVEHVLSREGAIGLAVFSSAALAALAVGAAILKKR